MSDIGLLASILKDTNRVISQSDADWSRIREGSYFKFIKDGVFYPVASAEEFLYIKDFKVINPTTVKITENIGINLSVYDSLSISYKEYELFTIFRVMESGQGYKNGDVLTVGDGILSPRLDSGLTSAVQLEVVEINADGGINKLKILKKGIYLQPPSDISSVLGGNGQNAKVKLEFKLLDTRVLIEREITEIRMNDIFTELKLNYALPANLQEGKLSAKKWVLNLASNYLQGTKVCENFDIARDFTPQLGLPLMAPNSFSMNAIFNDAMIKLDARIAGIEKRLT